MDMDSARETAREQLPAPGEPGDTGRGGDRVGKPRYGWWGYKAATQGPGTTVCERPPGGGAAQSGEERCA